MKTYLLIGPSGSGKTSACEIISGKTDIQIHDLDKVIKTKLGGASVSNFLRENGDEVFFNLSKLAIEEISQNALVDVIIVVGAGSINWDSSHPWYKQQNLISLTGDPGILYSRGGRQIHHPILDSYISTEFRMSRISLYNDAKYLIDVTNFTVEQTADKLIEIIKSNH